MKLKPGDRVWFTEKFLRSIGLSPANAAGRAVGRVVTVRGGEALVSWGRDCEGLEALEALELAVGREFMTAPPSMGAA